MQLTILSELNQSISVCIELWNSCGFCYKRTIGVSL